MFIQLDIKSPLYPFKKWVPVFYLQPFYLGCRVLIEAAEVESRKLSRPCVAIGVEAPYCIGIKVIQKCLSDFSTCKLR